MRQPLRFVVALASEARNRLNKSKYNHYLNNDKDMNNESVFNKSLTWERIESYARKVGRTAARPVLLTYYVLKDENTPRADKVVFAAALAYLVLPIDLISAKRFPVFGWLDELASVTIAYKRVAKHITPKIEQKADAQLDKWFPQAN